MKRDEGEVEKRWQNVVASAIGELSLGIGDRSTSEYSTDMFRLI